MDSINRGIPVLAFGVVGPSDCCIITGYDQGGDVLLGWSTYQDIPEDHNIPHDVTGYFGKPGWHENIPGYILIGAKGERCPGRKTSSALQGRFCTFQVHCDKLTNVRMQWRVGKTQGKRTVAVRLCPHAFPRCAGWLKAGV